MPGVFKGAKARSVRLEKSGYEENGALRSEGRDGTVRRMSTKRIEQQLADLQKRVEKLETATAQSDERKPRDRWQEAFGAMKDCEHFEEAMKLGAEWRAKANREGR